jgi:hypothetical protein
LTTGWVASCRARESSAGRPAGMVTADMGRVGGTRGARQPGCSRRYLEGSALASGEVALSPLCCA